MNEMRECLANHTAVALFLVVFIEQIGLPITAAPVLVASGALAADGAASPSMMILLTIAAALVADAIWYYLGWRGGGRVLDFFRRLLRYEPSAFERTGRLFAEHGVWLVAGAKFLPWLGNLIPPLAGMFHMSPGKFLRLDLLSSILYGGFYIGLGFFFSAEVNTALDVLSEISLSQIALALGLIFVMWAWKRRAATSSA